MPTTKIHLPNLLLHLPPQLKQHPKLFRPRFFIFLFLQIPTVPLFHLNFI